MAGDYSGLAQANILAPGVNNLAPSGPSDAQTVIGRIKGLVERLGMANNDIRQFADRWRGQGPATDDGAPRVNPVPNGAYAEISDALDHLENMVGCVATNADRLSTIA